MVGRKTKMIPELEAEGPLEQRRLPGGGNQREDLLSLASSWRGGEIGSILSFFGVHKKRWNRDDLLRPNQAFT